MNRIARVPNVEEFARKNPDRASVSVAPPAVLPAGPSTRTAPLEGAWPIAADLRAHCAGEAPPAVADAPADLGSANGVQPAVAAAAEQRDARIPEKGGAGTGSGGGDACESAKQRALRICREFAQAHDESIPTLSAKRKQLRERLEERLWAAACWRDFQLACVQRAFDAEMEQIEHDFTSEQSQLKSRLLADLLEHRRRLTDTKERLDQRTDGSNGNGNSNGGGGASHAVLSDSAKAPQRKLRSKRSGEGAEARGPQMGGKRRQQQAGVNDKPPPAANSFLRLGVSAELGEAEIYEDLGIIFKAETNGRRHARSAAHGQNKSSDEEEYSGANDVYLASDAVYCFGQPFSRGDAVVVGAPDSSEFTGTISAVSAKDVWIRVDDGAKLKVTYKQLRAGKYALSHAGQAG